MTPSVGHDPLIAALGQLHRLQPDTRRAGQVRARCRARLATRRTMTTGAEPSRARWRLVPALVVGGFCLLYTIGLVTTAVHVELLQR